MGAAMKSKHLIILNTLLFTICLSANLFAAGFAETYGMSAEGISRGNAMTATVNDWSSVFYNVAGLGKTQGLTAAPAAKEGEMTLKLRKAEGEGGDSGKKDIYPSQFATTLLVTIPKLKLNIQRYNRTSGGTPTYYPESTNAAKMNPYGFLIIGGVLDLNTIIKMPDFISSARLGIGMGMNWDFSMVKVNDIDPRTHNFIRYGKECQRAEVFIGAGMGFLNDAFGGGLGVNVAFHGKGKLYMEAQLTGDPQIPIGQTNMDLVIAPAAICGIYFSPGKFIQAINGLDIGASYRMAAKMKISPFDAAAGILGGAIGMNLMLAIFDYYTPHTVTTGIAYSRVGVTVSVDIDYEMWSKHEFSKIMEYHYYRGLPKFRDTLVYKFGFKYDTPLNWLSIMAGYSYVPSILDKKTGTQTSLRVGTTANKLVSGVYNLMDNDKHMASAGLKFTLPKMSLIKGITVITVGYQFQYLVPKSVSKNGFSYNLTTGTLDDVVQTYMLNPSYKYSGMNHSVVIEIGMKI